MRPEYRCEHSGSIEDTFRGGLGHMWPHVFRQCECRCEDSPTQLMFEHEYVRWDITIPQCMEMDDTSVGRRVKLTNEIGGNVLSKSL